jgi:hypothetical protein
MGWSDRAPALPATQAGRGHRRQGARHVTETRHFDRRNRHRYRQELVPHRGNRYLRSLFVQAARVVLVKIGPKHWTATGSTRGSRPQGSASTTTCWRLRSPTSSLASPGRFFRRGAPSSASRPMKQRTDPLNPRAVLGPVKAWPGNAGARGKASATANLDGPCARRASAHPQVGTKERPPATNKGTAPSQEAIDDVINTLTPPVLPEDETTMEDRSSRRVRTLVTRKARRGLSANEIACALISIMARNAIVPFTGRIQMRKTNHLQIAIFGLQRAAGPYRWAKSGSRALSYPNAPVIQPS